MEPDWVQDVPLSVPRVITPVAMQWKTNASADPTDFRNRNPNAMSIRQLKFLPIILLASSVWGCRHGGNSGIETIEIQDLRPQEVLLSKFASGMETIRLETGDDCLIGMIGGIKADSSRIYIADAVTRSLLIFNRNDGSFITKLHKQGRGPGEYLEINDFLIDEKAETIEILDSGKKHILVYDIGSLGFIREIGYPATAWAFHKKDNLYYLDSRRMSNVIDGVRTNSNVITFDPSTNNLKALFDYTRPEKENRAFWLAGFGYGRNGELYFSQIWDNTFYRLEKDATVSVLKVDGGRKEIPQNIKIGSYEQQEQFLQTNDGGYMFYKLTYMDDGKAAFLFTDGTNPYHYIYCLHSDDRTLLTDNIIVDFIESRPSLNFANTMVCGDEIITVWLPSAEQSPEASAFLRQVGAGKNDNPVITIFEIKP